VSLGIILSIIGEFPEKKRKILENDRIKPNNFTSKLFLSSIFIGMSKPHKNEDFFSPENFTEMWCASCRHFRHLMDSFHSNGWVKVMFLRLVSS